MAWEKEGAASMARWCERRRRRSAGVVWAEQASGWLGRLGQNLKEISFQNKKWFFEYIKTLEICTKRFRRNFDMVIFPKFF
jgi:hypothetical protein